jgi:hypothetical protein
MTIHKITEELSQLYEQYELAESVLCNASRLLDRLAAQIQPLEDALTRMEEDNGKLSEARTVSELRLAG